MLISEKLRGNQFAMFRIPRQIYVISKLSPIVDLGFDIINDERFEEFTLCMITLYLSPICLLLLKVK